GRGLEGEGRPQGAGGPRMPETGGVVDSGSPKTKMIACVTGGARRPGGEGRASRGAGRDRVAIKGSSGAGAAEGAARHKTATGLAEASGGAPQRPRRRQRTSHRHRRPGAVPPGASEQWDNRRGQSSGNVDELEADGSTTRVAPFHVGEARRTQPELTAPTSRP